MKQPFVDWQFLHDVAEAALKAIGITVLVPVLLVVMFAWAFNEGR